jgi:hypothetical protein
MATTYSLKATGVVSGNSLLTKQIYDIPDLSSSGIQTGVASGGGQANAMQIGDQMLVKRPDGSQGWYTLDAERSTVANPILLAVGP